ncbi:MAG: VanZ family protein [Ferruginibacter sp.]
MQVTTENVSLENKLVTKKFIPGIAWFFVVMVLMFTPGNDLPDVGDWFSQINFDKVIHIGVFGLLAYLFMRPIGKSLLPSKTKAQYFLKIAVGACIWGITTELVQKYFIPGRSFSLLDWAADSIGGVLAFFICKRTYLK